MVELPRRHDSAAASDPQPAAILPKRRIHATGIEMILKKHIHAAALMTASLFASGAHAQYVSSYVQPAPLYPYVAQPQYSYPQPQYAPQPYPYVQSGPNMRRISRDRDMPRASEPSRK